MNLTALKTWVSGETLTATDLNGEFQNIYTHTITNSDIDSTGTYVLGELVVGSGITAADGGQFHVHTASAGSVQAHADANEAVLENSAASGLSILSGSSSDGNIFFGDAADNDVGKIAYSHSANSLAFTTNGATALTLSSAQAATFAGDVSVGGALTLTGGLTLNGAVVVGDSASDTLTVNATVTSDLLFTDATYDIGASGATRPRDLFLSRNAVMGGTLGVTGLITATGGVSGALTGNVTGDLSGNVTGGTISGTTGTFSGDVAIGAASAGNKLDIITGNTLQSAVHIGEVDNEGFYISSIADTGTYLSVGAELDTSWYARATSSVIFGGEGGAFNVWVDGSLTDGSTFTPTNRFSLDSSGDLAVDTDTLFVDASADRVGFSTSSPATDVHLLTSGSTAQLRVESGLGNYTQLNANGLSNYSTTMDFDSVGHYIYKVSGSEKMRLTSAGLLGIGTSSPTRLLSLYSNSPTSVFQSFTNSSTGNTASDGSQIGIDSNNDLQIGQLESGKLIEFYNNGSLAMVIDSSQRVGIGTVSPSTKIHASGASSASALRLDESTSGANSYLGYLDTSGNFGIDVNGGGYLRFAVNGAERARIHSDGIITLSNNTNSYGTTGWYGVAADTSNGSINISRNGSNVAAFFHTSNANGINGSAVGTISITTTSTAYNTSSDYRLKENVVGITDGITRIKSLKPSRFNFISNADQTVDGFVAHEVSDIVPEAISGAKDAVDEEGNPQYQGIDQSKLVPLLTAALQEAITKIETLETKVAALEAA